MLQRILSRSLEFLYSGTESASGLLVDCDYMLVIKSFETQILTWEQEWIERRNWDGTGTFFHLPSGQLTQEIRTIYNSQIQAHDFPVLLPLCHVSAKFIRTSKCHGTCTGEHWPLLRSSSFFSHRLCHACSRSSRPQWFHEIFARLALCPDFIRCVESIEGSHMSPSDMYFC